MKGNHFILLIVSVVVSILEFQVDGGEVKFQCPVTITNSVVVEDVPGFGWDILSGKKMKPILKFTYNRCNIINGEILIPDNAAVRLSSDPIEPRGTEKSDDIHNLNYLAGWFSPVSPEEMPEPRTPENPFSSLRSLELAIPVTSNVTIWINPESHFKFQEEFKIRISTAILQIEQGDQEQADLKVQDIIRDYGTHMTISSIQPKKFEDLQSSLIPLEDLLTVSNFPLTSGESVDILRSLLKSAIRKYYAVNTRIGCTDPNSKNFDISANVPHPNKTPNFCNEDANLNFTFGGIYQTCGTNCDDSLNACSDYALNNILTGGKFCPFGFYDSGLRLNEFNKRICGHDNQTGETICEKCMIKYSAHWCFSSDPVQNSGLYFGGLYSSTVVNPNTRGYNCPQYFLPINFLTDLHVCLGNDVSSGSRGNLFGGFFSCSNGNPLASNGSVHYCPPGYSQHMAVDDQDCLINYCTLTNNEENSRSRLPYLPMKVSPSPKITNMQIWMELTKEIEKPDKSIIEGVPISLEERLVKVLVLTMAASIVAWIILACGVYTKLKRLSSNYVAGNATKEKAKIMDADDGDLPMLDV